MEADQRREDQRPCLSRPVGQLSDLEGYHVGHQHRPECVACRCGDQTSNPIPLTAAKSAAMAMAKGACGDYVAPAPIAHLNGLAAMLIVHDYD